MEYPVLRSCCSCAALPSLARRSGLHYDLIRPLRRVLPGLTPLWDLWFGLSSLALCCLFCLYLGQGQYHLFMLLGTVCGGSLYFLLCSRVVRRALAWCFDILSRSSKKIYFFLKKVFSFSKKRVIISNKYVRGALPRRQASPEGRRGSV